MPAAAYRGGEQYARAKRAQVTLNELWAQHVPASHTVFHAMHPGWSDTPGVQVVAAAVPVADGSAAALAGTGRRHDRVAGLRPAAPPAHPGGSGSTAASARSTSCHRHGAPTPRSADAACGTGASSTPAPTRSSLADADRHRRIRHRRADLRPRARPGPRRHAVRGRGQARRPRQHGRRRRSARPDRGRHRASSSTTTATTRTWWRCSTSSASRRSTPTMSFAVTDRDPSSATHGLTYRATSPEHVVRRSSQPRRARRCGGCCATSPASTGRRTSSWTNRTPDPTRPRSTEFLGDGGSRLLPRVRRVAPDPARRRGVVGRSGDVRRVPRPQPAHIPGQSRPARCAATGPNGATSPAAAAPTSTRWRVDSPGRSTSIHR